MRLKRTISALALAGGLSLGLLLQTLPAASAASAVPSARTTTVVHTGLTSPTSGNIPFIQENGCAGQTTTWVFIIRVELSGGSIYHQCFGFTGTWKFTSGDLVSYFCSGNNSGSFIYTVNGVAHGFNFGPGRKVNLGTGPNKPKTLTITGWSGTDRCTV
jgi:hypothetical protein